MNDAFHSNSSRERVRKISKNRSQYVDQQFKQKEKIFKEHFSTTVPSTWRTWNSWTRRMNYDKFQTIISHIFKDAQMFDVDNNLNVIRDTAIIYNAMKKALSNAERLFTIDNQILWIALRKIDIWRRKIHLNKCHSVIKYLDHVYELRNSVLR